MVRYAPFATVKMFSMATEAHSQGGSNFRAMEASVNGALQGMIRDTTGDPAIVQFIETLNSKFVSVGIADSISINEDYGTRPVYGIGEPTNPVLVPGNVSVRVSISRLTTDNRSISDYALKPLYWYDPSMQARAIATTTPGGATGARVSGLNADRPFHIYLAITDIEHGGRVPTDAFKYLNSYQVVEFMPVSYGTRISSENALIFTDVEGTGKILGAREMLGIMTGNVSSNAST